MLEDYKIVADKRIEALTNKASELEARTKKPNPWTVFLLGVVVGGAGIALTR